MTKRSYWRLRLDGKDHGLFRRTFTDDGDYAGLAYLGEEGWAESPDLLRWWLDPGDRDLIEVSREKAEKVAFTAGVNLDGFAGTSGERIRPEGREGADRASQTAEALARSPYARIVGRPANRRVFLLSAPGLLGLKRTLGRR